MVQHLASWSPDRGNSCRAICPRRPQHLGTAWTTCAFIHGVREGRGGSSSSSPPCWSHAQGWRDRRDPADIPRSINASYTEKRVLGRAIGAAWTNGPPGKTIGLCEGFETAAAYTSLTGIQAWASMGAKRFHQVEIPPSVERVILLADNDPEGRRAEARAREALLARPGLVIDTEWPPGRMNDWAQLLKR
jgi:hypothetical protein